MLTRSQIVGVGLLMLSAVLAGCGKPDREKELIGTWVPSATGIVGLMPQMTKETGNPIAGAGLAAFMGAATIEFSKDKRFDLVWGVSGSGTWTFNKETGEAILTITSTSEIVPPGRVVRRVLAQPTVYCAYLDEDNKGLRFYPVPPDQVEFLRQAGNGQGMANGIALKKK